MPIYSYQCATPGCRTVHEAHRKIDDRNLPATCPRCGAPAKLKIEATRGGFPGAANWRGGL